MPKKIKHHRPKYERSDIPFKDRLLMDRFNTVAEHRDHAALTAMKIATVALNDTEKMGYMTLARFARHQQELTELYYTNPEYQEVKLNERLLGMGFAVRNGRLYGFKDEEGNTVKEKTWRPAEMGDQELRPCPFCGGKARMETYPGMATRLRCSRAECYLHVNPWTSWHNGDTEEHAVQRLAAWWNGRANHGTE